MLHRVKFYLGILNSENAQFVKQSICFGYIYIAVQIAIY
jgi:hypothetical protein